MSAGAFVASKYESNVGDIYPCKVQPETLTAEFSSVANTAPTAAIDQPVSAFMRSRLSGYGMHARRVSVVFTATPPTGYKADQILTIPILTESLWDGILLGSTGEYLGVATRVVGKQAERSR